MKYYGKLFGEERSGKRPRYWDTGKTGQDWEDIDEERKTALVVATDAIRELDRILQTGDTYATREIVDNLKAFLKKPEPELDESQPLHLPMGA